MTKYKFGIVVLHYKTVRETIDCVDSILKLDSSDEAITLIVDNASNDNSPEIIKSRFANNVNVRYYQNKENLGFSRANNKAFEFLKKEYDVDYVIFLNNDTVINQKDFLIKIEEISKRDNYSILGPDVFAPKLKIHQNPLYLTIPTIKSLESEMSKKKAQIENIEVSEKEYIRNSKKILIKSKLPYFISVIMALVSKKKRKAFFAYKNAVENPVLMGACIILCPEYVSRFNTVFSPETKFYFEELILAKRCESLNLKTLYTPELKIIHYHGVSTRNSMRDIRQYISSVNSLTIEGYGIYKKNFYKDE